MGRLYSRFRPQQPAGPDVPKHRRRKDRKSWCKGIEGREHVLVWRQSKYQAQSWDRWRRESTQPVESEQVCQNCGKEGLGDRVTGRYYWYNYHDKPRPLGPAF